MWLTVLALQGPLEQVYKAALSLGVANQLTNILRDVGEDSIERDRWRPCLPGFGFQASRLQAGSASESTHQSYSLTQHSHSWGHHPHLAVLHNTMRSHLPHPQPHRQGCMEACKGHNSDVQRCRRSSINLLSDKVRQELCCHCLLGCMVHRAMFWSCGRYVCPGFLLCPAIDGLSPLCCVVVKGRPMYVSMPARRHMVVSAHVQMCSA